MRYELQEVWRYRELLWQLVRRDLKVRYKNSRLGIVWSIAPPLLEVAVITFVMKRATTLAGGFPSYSAFVLVAMIPWTYFQAAVLDSSQSVLMMYGVIRKVYMPREILPLASAISNFVHFLVSWAVFFIYWWVIARGPILSTTLLLPLFLIVQFMLVLGISFYVSCLNVFYEDVKYIISVFMRLGFFMLPIFYIADRVYNEGGRKLYMLFRFNPLAALMTGYRHILLESPSPVALKGPALPQDWVSLGFAAIVSVVMLISGYAYFNSRKWEFVERP